MQRVRDQTWSRKKHGYRRLFVLSSVLMPRVARDIDVGLLLPMAQCVEFGVPIKELVLYGLRFKPQPVPAIVWSLQTVFGRRGGVNEFLLFPLLEPQAHVATMSALVQCATLKRLHVAPAISRKEERLCGDKEAPATALRSMFAWLALVLMSPYRKAPLTLRLNATNLKRTDIAIMRQVVDHSDAVRFVCNPRANESDPCYCVRYLFERVGSSCHHHVRAPLRNPN